MAFRNFLILHGILTRMQKESHSQNIVHRKFSNYDIIAVLREAVLGEPVEDNIKMGIPKQIVNWIRVIDNSPIAGFYDRGGQPTSPIGNEILAVELYHCPVRSCAIKCKPNVS
jgi:hypothetical protein